jgi:filamentous hemagglutinin family protein
MTSVRAQVSPDGTLSTTVTNPDNLNFTINDGNRVGGNLFHSFREFSVPNGGSAVFQNALDVQNIISRVTGGSLSQINGLIQAQGSANLFLLNPAGISFGQNARLSIGGSFFATTADSLLFGDGIEFSATNPQAPLLTVNIPIGLRFRDNPGNITNQSVVQENNSPVGLQVNPGNSLALVGGNVSLEQGGRLTAAGGRIELGGLAGAGTVGLQTTGNTFTLNFPANGLSNVSLLDDARVAVRSNGGGEIAVNTNIFTATNGGRLVGGFEGIATSATRNGGDITVNSNEFNISGVGQSGSGAQIAQQVVDGASGNAGNIVVNTKSFNASSGAQLQNTVLSRGTGNAGNISITSNLLSLTNAVINSSTSGQGNAGDISLQVGDAIALSDSSLITANVQTGGSGTGGDIDIRGRSLTLTGGSQIQAGLFRQVDDIPGGIGTGGSIKINATDFIDISGFNPVSQLQSGIFAPAETGSTGPGGSINITTGAFRLTNFGIVIAGTANGNNGGDITINAKTFEATNGQVQTILIGQAEADGLFSAGDIQLNVTDSVSLKDGSIINSSTSGRGNAGNISLQVGDAIALTNGAQINSSTSGIGDAGDISLQVGDAIALSDSSFIITNVQAGGSGIGGDIDIRGRSLTLTGGSQIQAGLFRQVDDIPGGIGTGGSIKINATDFVDISGFNPVSRLQSGIFAPAETGSTGPGGSIDITTGAFRLTNFGIITARTANGNNGGNITINAKTFDATNGQVQTILSGQAEAGRLFSAGDIQLNVTDSLSLKDGSLIDSSTSGIGNAGNVTINASDISLNGAGSAISSSVEVGATGKGGDINIQTRTLSLTNGAEILALTRGDGIAGNIQVNATDSIFLNGVAPIVLPDARAGGFSSGLFSSSEDTSSGAGGQILVETPNLRILDGGVISARSRSAANAGNITVNSQNVELRGGGQILATAFNGGNAGNIDVTADNITISGADPTLNTRFNQVAQQFSRDIAERAIDPVQPESGIFVNSTGTGQGGNLSITGNSLTLDRGIINASTQSGNGGDITLNLRNFIRLRNESLISANARGEQGGNGGSITINTPFIVAFPQNNDIIANAVSGDGGRVSINRSANLFGIAPRRRADVPGLNPRNLPTSDITAFSEQNLNFGDNVQVNSPDVDPSRGLVELPEAVTDRTQQIAQNPCRQGFGNEFVVTGRGGFPTTPNETLSSDNVRVDLLQPVASSGNSRSVTKKPVTTVTARRVPAQGWIFNDKGQVVLTAYDPTNTGSQRSFRTAAACPAR